LGAASEIFHDMFACCDAGYVINMTDHNEQILDLAESSCVLRLLLHLINAAPEPYERVCPAPVNSYCIRPTFPDAAIPFPLIPTLIALAEKYALHQPVLHSLHSHLAAYASIYPLRVYGYSVQMGLDEVAGEASMYLLHPPLSTYTAEDVSVIPTAEAYHKLVLLHDHRTTRLRTLLMDEAIFPHGYGKCTKHHKSTATLWEQTKKTVAERILPDTDIAIEMAVVQQKVGSCPICYKAWEAAVSMLGYKAGKVCKRADQLPK